VTIEGQSCVQYTQWSQAKKEKLGKGTTQKIDTREREGGQVPKLETTQSAKKLRNEKKNVQRPREWKANADSTVT